MVVARSTLAQWVGECAEPNCRLLVHALADKLRRHVVLHANEPAVAMRKPGKGKTHKAHIWSYCMPSLVIQIEFCVDAKTNLGILAIGVQ